jgi:hypothetical protein
VPVRFKEKTVAKPISFGSYQFRTKNSAIEEARRRINNYEAGDKLNEDDELFFASLFTLHSEYSKKKGVGIDNIKVERDFHNNRCLYIHRIDGTEEECSWGHCIKPATQKQIVSMAFRRAVKERVMEYKNVNLPKVKVCPVLGTHLTHDNSHVSYLDPSFDQLLNDFLSQNGLTIDSVKLTNPKPDDADQRGILSNNNLAILWNEFHAKHACLQLLSSKANLRKTRS